MTQKITAIFGIAVMAAILLGGLTFSQSAFAGASTGGGPGGGQQKVTLCHVDQETGEEITITVGAPAVPAHLAHGDTLGECSVVPDCLECLENAMAANEKCLDEGGTEDECFIEIEPSFSECALACEGTDDEKENVCLNAAFVQAEVCLASGEDLIVCEADALAFFEECAGFALPA